MKPTDNSGILPESLISQTPAIPQQPIQPHIPQQPVQALPQQAPVKEASSQLPPFMQKANYNQQQYINKSFFKGPLNIVLSILTLIGILIIVVFSFVTYLSGNSIYKAPKSGFDTTLTNAFVGSPKDNPYRIILDINYKINDTPFMNHYKLFDYSYSVKDDTGNIIADGNKTFSYTRTGSDNNKGNRIISTRESVSEELATFKIEKDGKYTVQINTKTAPGLDSVFSLSDISYNIRNKVMILPPIIALVGAVLVFVPMTILIIKSKKDNKKNVQ